VSGSGISWDICKSAPRCRQITTPAPDHSVFTGRMPFLQPNQQCQSTEGITTNWDNLMINCKMFCKSCPWCLRLPRFTLWQVVLESRWPSGQSSTRWRKLRHCLLAMAVLRSGVQYRFADDTNHDSIDDSSVIGTGQKHLLPVRGNTAGTTVKPA